MGDLHNPSYSHFIPTSFPSLTEVHFPYPPTWTCLLMYIIFILIQIKFDIDTNNNELLKKYENIKGEREKKVDCH
jgi:hypothetical protein